MTKGIKIATSNIKTFNKDEIVVDSTKQGSWKIIKSVTIKTSLSRASGDPAISQVLPEAHNLGYTPAFIAMVEHDVGNGISLYNIPYYDDNNSYKVYVDSKKVYVSLVLGETGTFRYTFRILLLGEKIE